MAKSETRYLRIDDLDIPVKLIREWRNSVRISINKDIVHLRLPLWLPPSKQIPQNLDWAKNWLSKKFHSNPELRERFVVKTYHDGHVFSINEKSFIIKIQKSKNKTSTAKIQEEEIQFSISDSLNLQERNKQIPILLSRVIGKYFLPSFTARVNDLNDTYFNQGFKAVRLKNNRSNWGSCSARKNLNFSTRLLFAPREVQDYVILHELAHLIELNHSAKFWKLLSDIDPAYKSKEAWLKTNGHRCKF